MALYSIADLHLPLGIHKPMDVFGKAWENYVERLEENWQAVVHPEDTVILPGDFSWATYLEQAYLDFLYLSRLNGKKILVKGNHDYWWTTMTKMRQFTEQHGFNQIDFLQNNIVTYKDITICGTRGWIHPAWDGFSQEDRKIFDREVIRLELALSEAKKVQAQRIFVFTHYPPMGKEGAPNAFVEMMRSYGVEKCIYGHLHAASHKNAVEGQIDGIEYQLVSADYRQFMPLKISD